MDFASLFEVTAWDAVMLAFLLVLVYRWWKRQGQDIQVPQPKQLPTLLKQDMTLSELKKFNGVEDEHICFALSGTIYDVSRGSSFYGPGGPYGALAGHDATRALGSMDVKAVSDVWDDHEGMSASEKVCSTSGMQVYKPECLPTTLGLVCISPKTPEKLPRMTEGCPNRGRACMGVTDVQNTGESADEWEASFKYKYPTVGRLVKDSEKKADYEGALAIMAFMYPIHSPGVPVKWDDETWTMPLSSTLQNQLVGILAERIAQEKGQDTRIPDSVCDLRPDSDEEEDNDDDLPSNS